MDNFNNLRITNTKITNSSNRTPMAKGIGLFANYGFGSITIENSIFDNVQCKQCNMALMMNHAAAGALQIEST